MNAPLALRSRVPLRAASAAVLALLTLAPSRASAGAPDGAWASLGLLGGTTLPDARLADYQWDTRPRTAWGAQALAGTGRFALGLRAWRSRTVQLLDLPAGTLAPRVSTTTYELLARTRVARIAGTELGVTGSTGRLALTYRPDRVVVSSGAGGDVVAELSPVSAWTAGAGLAADRALFAHWHVGLSLDRRVFALDTAHRSGAGVVNARETFGDWDTRFELAWRHPLTVKGTSR